VAVEAVRKLRATWRANELLQRALEASFDEIGFDEQYVSACREAASSGWGPRKAKHIKDNIWGMVEVDWSSIRLLDCPVVQRLRGIKQLGLSYLTYPSAEHSRFIHSIGMACVTARLLDAIDHRATDTLDETGPDDLQYVALASLAPLRREDVIHAAILHDIGHMPFSHATETILSANEDLFTCGNDSVADILYTAHDQLRKTISFSEVLSLVVILSDRFTNFYNHYVRPGSEDDDALLRIASLIAGLPPNPRLSGVAEIISAAAIDADKIDYVNRDARACGIPVGVDISRVFLRSGLVSATERSFKKQA